MSKPTLSINGMTVEFQSGQTILEVARGAGVYTIPTLCYLKDTTATGSCRMCMVEVEGARTLLPACATAAAPGMADSNRVGSGWTPPAGWCWNSCWPRATTTAWSAKPMASASCRPWRTVIRCQPPVSPTRRIRQYYLEDNKNLIRRDFSKCIMCGRCVRACNEKQVNQAISIGYRGTDNKIVTRSDFAYSESDCVFCGECVQACPVGALLELKAMGKARSWETRKVRTTCPYCGVGCQQWLHVKAGKIVKVTGVEGAAPNKGRLCVKGRFGYDFIYSPERLTMPLIKENGEFREASWDEALDLVAISSKRPSISTAPTPSPASVAPAVSTKILIRCKNFSAP